MRQGVSPSRGCRNIRGNILESKIEQIDGGSLAFNSRFI